MTGAQAAAAAARVVLALGSNLGDRLHSLQGALDALFDTSGLVFVAVSPVYETAPVGGPAQPDYLNAVVLAESRLPAPVILTGGLSDAERVREAFSVTGAAAVMLARGALGNPWLFSELLGEREEGPTRAEVLAELGWTIDRAVEHMGRERATRYLRKFYPWYLARLELGPRDARRLQSALQLAPSLEEVTELLVLDGAPLATAPLAGKRHPVAL